MNISKNILDLFNGKKIKATAINIKCVEDIDDIRLHLKMKYGEENIQENDNVFLVNDKVYHKPWLPRERTGTFNIRGENYYIEAESSSAVGRLKPRRSFYPINVLSIKDERTIIATIDSKKDYFIEYTLEV